MRLRPILGPVSAGSIAANAGLREGDVIEAVGAAAVRTRGAARARILSAIRSRGRVQLLVGADGSSRPVTLEATGSGTPLSLTRLGVRFAAGHIPTKIARVVPGGPAAKAGLEAGDRIVSVEGQVVRRAAASGQAAHECSTSCGEWGDQSRSSTYGTRHERQFQSGEEPAT